MGFISKLIMKKIFIWLIILIVVVILSAIIFNYITASLGPNTGYDFIPYGGDDCLGCNKPTLTKSLVFPKDIILDKGKTDFSLVYYNHGTKEITNVKIGVSECLNGDGESFIIEEGGSENDFLLVLSKTYGAIQPNDYGSFHVKILDNSENTKFDLIKGTYVCRLIVYTSDISEGLGSLQEPYEEKQFFLNVVE